jgi:uncharacterized delta-60 repeat protein
MLSKTLAAILIAFSLVAFSSTVSGQPWSLRAGKIDKSFGDNGFKFLDKMYGSFNTVPLLQPDGKLVICRTGSNEAGFVILVSRFLPNGDIDLSFDEDGHKLLSFEQDTFGVAITQQSDGKLLISGSTGNNFSPFDFLIIRLTVSGDLDPTFGDKGVVIKDFAVAGAEEVSSDHASSLIVLPDGKVLVGGKSDRYLPSAPVATTYSTLFRLMPDGTVDETYASGGVSQVVIGNDPTNNTLAKRSVMLAIQPDGKVLAGVTVERPDPTVPRGFGSRAIVLRYDQNGGLDPLFGQNGSLALFPDQPCFLISLTLLPNGKFLILLPGALMRVNAEGSPDPTFGSAGLVSTGSFMPTSLAVSSDQKITIAGYEFVDGTPQPGSRQIGRLQRLGWNGIPDPRFGWAGITRIDLGSNTNVILGQLYLYEGKIVAIGTSGPNHHAGQLFVSRFYATK